MYKASLLPSLRHEVVTQLMVSPSLGE